MAISSMTGYGRSDGAFEDRTWYWEVRSVNGKGLDLKFRLPQTFDSIELNCRKHAQYQLGRGNVQCSLSLTNADNKPTLQINEDALQLALSHIEAIEEKTQTRPSSATEILAMSGVLERTVEEPNQELLDALGQALYNSFEEALSALKQARASEGKHLEDIISGLVQQISDLTDEASANPSRSATAIQERLFKQVSLLSDGKSRLDGDRLHQEAMLIATKADIQEEIDRLLAHVAAAKELLAADEPVGRKFDFLTQEFNREANTLCSKSNDPSLTKIGLALKAAVDQMREQIQNIE
ncbi:MAG: YicC/YloC family endoribonuclease [Hyphomicrobiales bacterium]